MTALHVATFVDVHIRSPLFTLAKIPVRRFTVCWSIDIGPQITHGWPDEIMDQHSRSHYL